MRKFYPPIIRVAVFSALFSLLLWWFTYGDDEYLKHADINIRWLSWSIPPDAAHPWDSHPSLDWILETTDIQSFTQNWYDLDLFFVDNEWNVWHHTIMDRNMWASEVFNKKFGLSNINTWSFGYRYQWWNNYWFRPCYTNWCSGFSESYDGIVVPYYIRNYVYNEGVWDRYNPLPYFAHNVWDEWYTAIDSVNEVFMWEYSTPPLSVRHQQSKNLRWWVWDTYDEQWIYTEWNWTIPYNDKRTHSRKWPCPEWYHIPSMKEWDKILLWWGYANNKEVNVGGYYGNSIWWNNGWKNFASDLLLPPTWYRKAQGGIWEQQWDVGEYRSSSPYENVRGTCEGCEDIVARVLEFNSDEISENSRATSQASQEGKSIRCIKDSPDSELNIYPNGWTNAFVSVYRGKIIALWAPKRAWYTFEWWYTNEDFTGERVDVWDSIGWRRENSNWSFTSIPHLDLYAKRKGNPKCTDLPANATANNSKTPSIDTKYYYSADIDAVCTFHCNANYTWDSTTSKCVANGCQWTLPDNATLWNPSVVPSNNTTSYSYSATSTTEACKFKCNSNYTWNSSTSSCESNNPTTYQCIGTLPANSTRNNNLTPDRNTSYYYSTDTSLACTFQCNPNYTWSSSTSSCKATIQAYVLTINYKYSDWSTASPTVNEIVLGGDSYSITSPTITNYTASTSVVEWTMPYSHKTIDVIYTKIQTTWWGGWWSSSSSSSNSTLEISASPSSPDIYEWIKVTIETDDDYTDKVYFSKLQYRSSSSSSWSNISRTSSTYVSDYSSYWSNGYYKMTSSDDGEVTLRNLVEFKKSGYYRIYVEDTDGNEDYVQINVYGSDSTSNSTLEISVSPSSPDTYEWIKLTIETNYNYTDKIYFSKLQYRSSSSSSWSDISRTSSTYISDYSSYWSNGYYKMTSSDYGNTTLKNLVKFKKSGYYRIYVKDTDGNEDYVQINVNEDSENNSSESSNDSNLSLSVNNVYPITYDPIALTINTDNYVGKIKLYAKYKSSSDSRIKISNNSSNEYFSDFSNIWENWYYKMTSSDKWKKTLYNLISFKNSWTYRIYAEDEQWYFNYITIEAISKAYSSDNINTSNTQTKTESYDSTWDDIDKLINQLLGTDTSNNSTNNTSSNKNNDDIEWNKNNLTNVSDEIYTSRSCKQYRLQYDSRLWVFTSQNLQKTEYFINKEYFKRYIDSKNPQKEWCPTNAWWITVSYKDSSTSTSHFVAPNGKVYFISIENWSYYSNNLTTQKKFSSITEIKNFIKTNNPLISMEGKK